MSEPIKNVITKDANGNIFVNGIPYGNPIAKNFANNAELSDWWSSNPKAVVVSQPKGIQFPKTMEFVFPL